MLIASTTYSTTFLTSIEYDSLGQSLQSMQSRVPPFTYPLTDKLGVDICENW